MKRASTLLVAVTVAVVALGLTACADDDTTAGTQSESRTVEIEMRDIAFAPNEIDVQAGETVRFVFTNAGAVPHAAFIGDEAAQEGHEMEMREMGGHDSMSGEDGITVEPGESAEITHIFAEGDRLVIGCHEEGHYAAGMRVAINVT